MKKGVEGFLYKEFIINNDIFIQKKIKTGSFFASF